MSLAAECHVANRVHILPLAPPGRMEALAAVYDIGLCSEIGHTRNRKIALTNKQFTYLLAGLPVLMSNIPAHVEFSRQAEGAVELFEVDNPVGMASAIDRILDMPERLSAMRKTAWLLGQSRFNAEIEVAKIVGAAARVLGLCHRSLQRASQAAS